VPITYPPGNVRKETFHTLSFVGPALEPGWSVLDIGCGAGYVLGELAPERDVMGIDIVDLRAIELPRFALYDGLTVPCEDDSFDVVLLTFVLHHVPNDRKAQLVAEARRVARRRVVVLEDTPKNPIDQLACWAHGHMHRRRIGTQADFGFYSQKKWENFFVERGLRVATSTALPRFGRDLIRPWARTGFVLEK
jgi:ubiquinone/menaquinone biosynthesis C-methylase UbiE